jgi:hypothetical protein
LPSFSARGAAVVLLPKAVGYPAEKAFAEPYGDVERAIIAEQMDRVPHTIQYGIAMPALPEVLPHGCAQLFRQVVLEVTGQFTPDVFTVDSHLYVSFASFSAEPIHRSCCRLADNTIRNRQ